MGKNNDKKSQKQEGNEEQSLSEEQEGSFDDVNDESEDEYDEDVDSDDENFIASDEEVQKEIEEAQKMRKKEQKKMMRDKNDFEIVKRQKNSRTKIEEELDEDDIEIIKGQKRKTKKLKKLNDDEDNFQSQQQDKIESQTQMHENDEQVKKHRQRNYDDEDEEQNQNSKKLKNQFDEEKRNKYAQRKKDDGLQLKQDSEMSPEYYQEDDEESQTAQQQQLKYLKEEYEELFTSPLDHEIAQKDIPERLQIKLQDRFNPSQEEIVMEAQWIFDNIIETLDESKQSLHQSKIQIIQIKIQKALKYIRCSNFDIPYITKYRLQEFLPEFNEEKIWRIFNLDVEYGKFLIHKKLVKDFFESIKQFDIKIDEIQNYINSIHCISNQRDLSDYDSLIEFYKSYFHQELDQLAIKNGRKLPGLQKTFIQQARQQRLDEFARRFSLSPSNFLENIQKDELIYQPDLPASFYIKDIAREYFTSQQISEQIPFDQENYEKQIKEVTKQMCKYAAAELWVQPEIRKNLKTFIKEHGTIITQPTEKGMKELDVLHASYRVKRVNKRLQDFDEPDLFLDIIQNEKLGLIQYDIEIQNSHEYFNRMFEKYQCPPANNELERRWQNARNEIQRIFCNDPMSNKSKQTFVQAIIEEVKNDLKEDAESFVINKCKNQYRDLLKMGYFKINNETNNWLNEKRINNEMDNIPLVEDDFIPQRQRLIVMGAILNPVDNKNFTTTLAIVDRQGKLLENKEFFHQLPKDTNRRYENDKQDLRPGEIEERQNYLKFKQQIQDLLIKHQVDLIVVSADCLEARRLKKALSEFVNIKKNEDLLANDQYNESNYGGEYQQDESAINLKDALVIWGRPEIPKLFSTSHQSQNLMKNFQINVKKAVCLARFEQDPMNEIFNLWSPIMSENQALNLSLHPLQKLINKAKLMDSLEDVNVQVLNEVGIDINMLIDNQHLQNQLQFLSAFGPRKAQQFLIKSKLRAKPLTSRIEIYDKQFITKNCFFQCIGFIKVRVPIEKRTIEIFNVNNLDQTRIHPNDYETIQKIAVYCIFGKEDYSKIDEVKIVQAVNELFKNNQKLQELQNSEFKDYIFSQQQNQPQEGIEKNLNIEHIIKDFINPFRDPREDKNVVRKKNDQKFPSNELFYCLIDENERTFKKGMIVLATVVRIYYQGSSIQRILCRLDNGLDANIYEYDVDFIKEINVGSTIQGRVDQIKYGQSQNDENFSVNLKCKQSDLRRHDLYAINHDNVPEQDLVNINFKAVEDQQQISKQPSAFQKRNIQHPRFQNISSQIAVQMLQKEDNGKYYFRPSSKGMNNLSLTWKFYENNIVHIDIKELDKPQGSNIGRRLQISDEYYENLQEIVERYIIPCNRSLIEVIQHVKFQKCNDLEDINQLLLKEKSENEQNIPYKFTIIDQYPQYIILLYIPKKDVVREYIKIKPKGYYFHQQYQNPFQNLVNWFKKNFRTREYQQYLRKVASPQKIEYQKPLQLRQGQQQQQIGEIYTKNIQNQGMQIDKKYNDNKYYNQQDNEDYYKKDYESKNYHGNERGPKQNTNGNGRQSSRNEWGGNARSSSESYKKENIYQRNKYQDQGISEYGRNQRKEDQNMQSPRYKDNQYKSQAGRGFGRGNNSSRNCNRCGQEGHILKNCPNSENVRFKDSFARGPENYQRSNKCFNCNEEGHFSRDCQKPKKDRYERENEEDYPYKRQKRNDDGGSFRKKNNESSWKGLMDAEDHNGRPNDERNYLNQNQNNIQLLDKYQQNTEAWTRQNNDNKYPLQE